MTLRSVLQIAGDRIEVFWRFDNMYYKGAVLYVDDGAKQTIKYNDDDQ